VVESIASPTSPDSEAAPPAIEIGEAGRGAAELIPGSTSDVAIVVGS
jgi:hypothetical protein